MMRIAVDPYSTHRFIAWRQQTLTQAISRAQLNLVQPVLTPQTTLFLRRPTPRGSVIFINYVIVHRRSTTSSFRTVPVWELISVLHG